VTKSKRILIFGNSGSGKSYLARAISSQWSLPVVSLDTLFWEPGSYVTKRPADLVQLDVQEEAAKDSWIIEGVFGELVAHALARAEVVIWLSLGTEECLSALKERGFTCSDEAQRPEMERSFEKLLEWAKGYEVRTNERSFEGHKRLFDEYVGTKVRLNDRAAIDAYIRSST